VKRHGRQENERRETRDESGGPAQRSKRRILIAVEVLANSHSLCDTSSILSDHRRSTPLPSNRGASLVPWISLILPLFSTRWMERIALPMPGKVKRVWDVSGHTEPDWAWG
jgi:hypothetical protein